MITAVEAMARAVSEAEGGRQEQARLWLDIARELREGSTSESAPTIRAKQTDTQSLRRPDPRPGGVIEVDHTLDGTRCANCGYFVVWDGETLVHTRTGQVTCPVGKPGPDDTVVHTFAVPE